MNAWYFQNNTASDPEVLSSPSELFFVAIPGFGDGLLYLPPNYHATINKNRKYPVFIFGCGDGAKGSTQTVTGAAVGGSSPNFSGNFANGTNDILRTSLKLYDNGVQFAHGDKAGNIIQDSNGADIGNFNATSTNGSYSFTYTASGTVTMSYQHSALLFEGPCPYLNSGDEPKDIPGEKGDACIFLMTQLPSAQTDYNLDDLNDWMKFLIAGYRVDLTRVNYNGISRGTFLADNLMSSRPTEIASYSLAAGFQSGSGFGAWSTIVNRGVFMVHGTADGTVTNIMQSLANSMGTTDMIFPWEFLPIFGANHNATVWHDNIYNRKYRTDGVGLAEFDYIRKGLRFSTNQETQATLFVEYVEDTELIEDYRHAVNQVDLLSASALKTSLEGRLASLKPTIDKGGRRFYVDYSDANSTTSGNWNNKTSATGTVSSLIDDTGASSTIDLVTINSTGTEGGISGSRMNQRYFGFPISAMADGQRLQTTITNGQERLESLNPAKIYDLRFYHVQANNSFTTEKEMSITINGVTKTQYSDLNTTRYIEFTGLVPDGSNFITFDKDWVGDEVSHEVLEILEYNP